MKVNEEVGAFIAHTKKLLEAHCPDATYSDEDVQAGFDAGDSEYMTMKNIRKRHAAGKK